LSQKTNSLFGFGQIFLAVVLVSFSFWFIWVLVLAQPPVGKLSVSKFCLVFSISVLALVKVLVNFGL